MAKKIKELYTQKITIKQDLDELTLGGPANQIVKVPSAFSAKDRTGMVIQKVQYDLSPTAIIHEMLAVSQKLCWGLCYLSQATKAWGFDPGSAGLLDINSLESYLSAAPLEESGTYWRPDWVKNFSGLLGGGLLVHPSVLYCWTGSPLTWTAESYLLYTTIYYYTIPLSDPEYTELWEARVMSQTI